MFDIVLVWLGPKSGWSLEGGGSVRPEGAGLSLVPQERVVHLSKIDHNFDQFFKR